jgi:exodeoxyribonuclease VII small subunit
MPSKKQQSELPLHPAAQLAPESSELVPHEVAGETSFEDAIERLSQIVEALESAGLPLEESLKLFEEGVQLARKSQARLDSAERKVQELLAYDDGGRPIVEEFDPE